MFGKRKAMLVHQGVRLRNDPTIMTPNILKAIDSGKYEHKEARQLVQIIQPGERVMEIGGGIGFLSTLMARQPEVESVLVYEANPGLISYMQETHKNNGIEDVKVRNAILTSGPAQDKVSFYLRNDFWASSTLPEPWGFREEVKVPTEDLNDSVSTFKPTLIVCDIEGGEAELFDYASLPGVRHVLLELHQRVTGGSGIRNVFDNMSRMNFHYNEDFSSGPIVTFTRLQDA